MDSVTRVTTPDKKLFRDSFAVNRFVLRPNRPERPPAQVREPAPACLPLRSAPAAILDMDTYTSNGKFARRPCALATHGAAAKKSSIYAGSSRTARERLAHRTTQRQRTWTLVYKF